MDEDVQVIVTGANGFLGKKICCSLEKNFKVLRVDFEDKCDVKINLLDENSLEKLEEYTKKPLVFLIYLAFISPLQEKMEIRNMKMIEELSNFLENHPNVFLLYPSTALVYGVRRQEAVTEDCSPNPESPYAQVKLNIEEILLNRFPTRCTIFRLTNVYGCPIKENTVIGKIISQIKKNQKISLNNYDSVRDFIYVDDVVKAFGLMIKYIKIFEETKENEKMESPYSTFNLSTGKPICIYELASKIASYYKKLELLDEKENVLNHGYSEYLAPSPVKLEKLINVDLILHEKKGLYSPLKPLNIEEGLERMKINE